jgi:hypothetical protein
MDLVSYLMMDVKPLWDNIEHIGNTRHKSISQAGRQNMRKAAMKKKIAMYEKAFSHFKYRASTSQIANFLGQDKSNLGRALKEFAEKGTYLSYKHLTREEEIELNLPQSRGNTALLWTWNPNGQITEEDF